MSGNKTPMHIQMLGGFELRSGGHVISENTSRSYQMWNLLEYLIAHRRQEVSQAEIIEALWPDEGSDNPANALKNLVYRIRTALSAAGFPGGRDMVRYANGTYCFNNALDCVVDAEEFERLCKLADHPEATPEQREKNLSQAAGLYKGDFLPRSRHEPWVVPIAAYYHNLYLRSVNKLAVLLTARRRYEEIVRVCEEALLVDPFEESLHEEIIRALLAQNKQKKAMEHYQYATDLFYRGMGVKPSENLRSLYREIIKTVNMVETDLEIIKEDLRESSRAEGAFLCDYEVFRNMYQLEARSAVRSGQAVFLGLMTLAPAGDGILGQRVFAAAMDKLQEALRTSLRRGDVISRFSATQYVLMLPTITFENGQMVLSRVAKKFSELYRNPMLQLTFALLPLDAVL